ncbi:MAG: hypothetical protein Q8Q36_00685 [bacterium]|nr:hypothetical protein [bacterium]
MLKSFFRFAFGFLALVLIGLGALALTSFAAPYLGNTKAAVLSAFEF